MLQTPDAIRGFLSFGIYRKFTRIRPGLFPLRVVPVIVEMDLHNLARFPLADYFSIGGLRQTARTLRTGELDETATGHYRDARGNSEHTYDVKWNVPA